MTTKLVIQSNAIVADKPNANGRIYSRELIEDINEQIINDKKGVYVTVLADDISPDLILTNIAGKVTFSEIDDQQNSLVITAEILDTPKGKIINQLADSGITFRLYPVGVGMIEEDGSITSYEFSHFNIEPYDQNK